MGQAVVMLVKNTYEKVIPLEFWVALPFPLDAYAKKPRRVKLNDIPQIDCQTQRIESWSKVCTCCRYTHCHSNYPIQLRL